LISLFFHFSIRSNAVVVRHPLSALLLVYRRPILRAFVVRHLHLPPLLSSAIIVVIVRCCCCPPPPSSAAAAVIATPCPHRLSMPTLVLPLCSPPPNLACPCHPLLMLSAFAVVIHRCHHLPPQPSSPLCCLCCLLLPTLILPHPSLPPNQARCCRLPPLSSATVIVHCRRTFFCPPSYRMLIVVLCHAGPPQQVICDGVNVP
jgi:hypothetical protein